LRRQLLTLAFTIATLLYATVTNTALRLVVCGTVSISPVAFAALDGAAPGGAPASSSGFVSALVLTNNPSFICCAPGGSHLPAAVIAWATILLFVVAYPLATFWWVASRLAQQVRRRFAHVRAAAILAISTACPPGTASQDLVGDVASCVDDAALVRKDDAALAALVVRAYPPGLHGLMVCCFGRRCIARRLSPSPPKKRRLLLRPRVNPLRSTPAHGLPGVVAEQLPHSDMRSDPLRACILRTLRMPPPSPTQPFYVTGLGRSLVVDFSPLLLSSVQHFVGSAYRLSIFYARHADMLTIAALATLQTVLVHPDTVALVLVRGASVVVVLLAAAWFFGTRRPFRIGENWKLYVKVGSLLLAALGTVLTHTSLVLQTTAQEYKNDPGPSLPAPRVVVVLSYTVLCGSVMLFATLMFGFWVGMFAGARLESRRVEAASAAAATSRTVIRTRAGRRDRALRSERRDANGQAQVLDESLGSGVTVNPIVRAVLAGVPARAVPQRDGFTDADSQGPITSSAEGVTAMHRRADHFSPQTHLMLRGLRPAPRHPDVAAREKNGLSHALPRRDFLCSAFGSGLPTSCDGSVNHNGPASPAVQTASQLESGDTLHLIEHTPKTMRLVGRVVCSTVLPVAWGQPHPSQLRLALDGEFAGPTLGTFPAIRSTDVSPEPRASFAGERARWGRYSHGRHSES
jgi:hypothetical protein